MKSTKSKSTKISRIGGECSVTASVISVSVSLSLFTANKQDKSNRYKRKQCATINFISMMCSCNIYYNRGQYHRVAVLGKWQPCRKKETERERR